jgi:hypothetical protein
MQGVENTEQVAVALAWTGAPQMLVAVAVTVFVLALQVAVKVLV